MISEPNFVHGIKQTSIHSKEVSYMHSTDPQYPCLFLDLNPTASHAITVQAIHASLFKSVQIKASPDEINTIDMLHGFPQPKPRNLVSIGSLTHHQEWTKALASPPTLRQNS